MTVVVDATLLVALGSGDARAEQVTAAMERWLVEGESLAAPELIRYEVASGLTRLVAAGLVPRERVASIWNELSLLPVRLHRLEAGQRVVEIALSLSRKSAYDAAYLALAEELGAMLWTLDERLYNNAAPKGQPIRLLA
jgi:predicted nucleic acid-binding protein